MVFLLHPVGLCGATTHPTSSLLLEPSPPPPPPASHAAHTRTTAGLAEGVAQDWGPSAEVLPEATSQMMLVFRGQAPGRPGSPPSPPLPGPPDHGPHVYVTPWGPHRLWSPPHGDLSPCQFLSPRVSARIPVLNHSSAYVCLSPCVSGSLRLCLSVSLCLTHSH